MMMILVRVVVIVAALVFVIVLVIVSVIVSVIVNIRAFVVVDEIDAARAVRALLVLLLM